MGVERLILISGIEVKNNKAVKDVVKNQKISRDDIRLTELIISIGSKFMDRYDDISYLYKKYVNPNAYLCGGCSGDVSRAFEYYKGLYIRWVLVNDNKFREEVIDMIIKEKREGLK